MKFFRFREFSFPVLSFYFLVFGMIFLIVGMFCNFLVITSNGGLMPVYRSQVFSTSEHFTITFIDDINYLFLADIYPIGLMVYSLGDFLIWLGMSLLVLGFLIVVYNSLLSIPCFGGYR